MTIFFFHPGDKERREKKIYGTPKKLKRFISTEQFLGRWGGECFKV